jgi:hypothetical protein
MRKYKKQQDRIPMIQLEAKKEIVTKTTKTESDPQRHRPRKTNKQQNIVGDGTQSPAKLRAVLIKTEGQLERAGRQVHTISKTRVADTFLEGQVRTWTKETLWKMCKFITNDQTMHKVMHKASKHFKVPASEQEH